MNAALALWLIEQSIPLDKAKAIAETAISADDVAFGILDALPGALSVAEARELAAQAPLIVDYASGKPEPGRPDPAEQLRPAAKSHDTPKVAHGTYSPATGPDGLTEAQRTAVQRGVQLCPNCQQPVTDHLPGCARASWGGHEPMNPKARTKDPLPPAV